MKNYYIYITFLPFHSNVNARLSGHTAECDFVILVFKKCVPMTDSVTLFHANALRPQQILNLSTTWVARSC